MQLTKLIAKKNSIRRDVTSGICYNIIATMVLFLCKDLLSVKYIAKCAKIKRITEKKYIYADLFGCIMRMCKRNCYYGTCMMHVRMNAEILLCLHILFDILSAYISRYLIIQNE